MVCVCRVRFSEDEEDCDFHLAALSDTEVELKDRRKANVFWKDSKEVTEVSVVRYNDIVLGTGWSGTFVWSCPFFLWGGGGGGGVWVFSCVYMCVCISISV